MEVNTASTHSAVQMVQQYSATISQFMLMGGIYLAPIALWFLWYGLKRNFKSKMLHILYILCCSYVFAFLIGGGIVLGARFGYGAFGALGGVVAFWAIFNLLLKLKAKKDFRERV